MLSFNISLTMVSLSLIVGHTLFCMNLLLKVRTVANTLDRRALGCAKLGKLRPLLEIETLHDYRTFNKVNERSR